MSVLAVRKFMPRSRKRERLRTYSTDRRRVLQMTHPEHAHIVQHAMEDAPFECCGLIALQYNRVVKIFRADNVAGDPMNYFMVDPGVAQRIVEEIGLLGWEFAVYHSHPMSDAQLSADDFNFALPGVLQIVVGLGAGPMMRAWSIEPGGTFEVRVEVDPK